MLPILLIHQQINIREDYINSFLVQQNLTNPHPNLLLLAPEEKLGIEQIRKIRDFLALKPYQSNQQAVIITAAENLTIEAQNGLLKILEEPNQELIIILGVNSEDQLLATILSRCQVINLYSKESYQTTSPDQSEKFQQNMANLLKATGSERFQIIEKLEEKEDFLKALTAFYHQKLVTGNNLEIKVNKDFLCDLMMAEKWAKQNVNIRAILEYLMLKLPMVESS